MSDRSSVAARRALRLRRGCGWLALALFACLSGPAPAAEVNPPLPRATVVIGARVRVSAEVARTDREREVGLSNRPVLRDGEGMLFLFGRVGPARIWMKDMHFPLDILWIREGRIVMIKERAQPLRPDRPPEIFGAEADSVLELPAGFAAARGISLGDAVALRGGPGGSAGNR